VADIIAYYRVSTRKQGESGLGLEGQKAAVEAYSKQTGARILASYREIESGKRSDRPELAKALAHSKRSKAVLVVAKLDRLARNVEFMAKLMNSAVDFIALDNPNANRLTIHILAAVAEAEAKATSDRTKAALQAYKARGGKLGAELLPAAEAFQGGVSSRRTRADALRSAANAAAEGVRATAKMFPQRGRSRYLGERVLGYPDPGAEAVAVVLDALARG